ncbi:MAG: RdgB/HAM1 family non-canonical purine NTP pyrophosphatase [Betaproteobacteria bacterium]|nr:RdgB/HAM1 family non-canonical purine NTP pyrophosphatase [Betaproteobacteria bacterium]
MKQLVIASSNPGKLRELEALLAPLGIEIVPQAKLGVGEADEPHATFVENALAKARHASRAARLPALADDSGICASALDGEPGVHSARYAGEPSSDERNNQKLVAQLAGQEDRRAHYTCVMVLVRRFDDPEPLIAEGHWEGKIIDTPRGTNGFGYDPYFYLPDFGMTAAELDPECKNSISHRGKALRRLVAELKLGSGLAL